VIGFDRSKVSILKVTTLYRAPPGSSSAANRPKISRRKSFDGGAALVAASTNILPLPKTCSMMRDRTFERPAAEPIQPWRNSSVNCRLLNRRLQLSHVMRTPPFGPCTVSDLSTVATSQRAHTFPTPYPHRARPWLWFRRFLRKKAVRRDETP
jgi:hypothetical protein